MNSKLLTIFISLLSVSIAVSQSADSVLVLDQIIQEALNNNIALKASQRRWEAAEAGVSPKGALPDPVLGFNILNLPTDNFVFDQEPMTGKQVVLTQKIPFPGKLKSEKKIARENSKYHEMQLQEQKNQLIKSIKVNFYTLNYIDQALATVRKNAGLLRQFVAIAQTRYQVGKGIQQNYLQAELELARNMEKEIVWQQKRNEFAARLNQLLNRPASQVVPATQSTKPFSIELNLADLMQMAGDKRPLNYAWKALVRQGSEKVRLARKSFWPDFTLGLAYTHREVLKNGTGGVDYLSGMFSVNLPLYFWQKQKPLVVSSQRSEESLKSQYENYLLELETEMEIKLSELNQQQKLLNLYDSQIIYQAEQNLESARGAYQVDKVDFLTLLNSQMVLFNYQLDYHRVKKGFFVSLAELEALTGGSLK